ncbi:DoxX family protein [Modestobacter versicolor]|uniref:Putative membrane protein YphA (DoxX/SURF4 family) n=1 Tax=Modestobacter versicolor TaxID=429133 RepID=A0A839XWL0_9ACTN|nr:DoxX family protein [Modestobacter versicolor]MBB3675418.1 putative membrane protein YphA (DoxX/SURF4 family) [Modestobacter versicolor]
MSTTAAPVRTGPRPQRVLGRVLRIGLAVVFLAAGLSKLAGAPELVDLFDDIGAGQWLRYLVGVCEVAGAVGLLVPRLTRPAALGLTALMVGATVVNVAVLQVSPLVTVVLALAAGTTAALSPGSRRR